MCITLSRFIELLSRAFGRIAYFVSHIPYGEYLNWGYTVLMEYRSKDFFTHSSKVGEIGVTSGLNWREPLSPSSTFIPSFRVETNFMNKTDRIDRATSHHERHFRLTHKMKTGDTAFLWHLDRVERFPHLL